MERRWYQKKRYIVPLGVLILAFWGFIGDSSQSSPSTQTVSVQNSSSEKTTLPSQSFTQPSSEKQTQSGTNLSNDNYYVNTAGNTVHSPAYADTVPVGASAQCRDGTYSFSQSRRGTCSHHGGVARWL